MTSLGKLTHIRRLQNPQSDRILTVAIDHAPSYGVLHGLEDIADVLQRVAEGKPDAILLMQGPAARCYEPYAGRIPLILKTSTLSPFHPAKDVWVTPVETALRLGADAVAMALTVGSGEQSNLAANLSGLVQQAERAGLPVIVHAYPNGPLIPSDEVFSTTEVSYAARLAMELGVDIVKTFYTGSAESFAKVVEAAAPALVVAAGGPRLETDEDVLHMAHGVVEAGAAGITFGRNIWQSERPTTMIAALSMILHQGSSVAEALDFLTNESAD
ncbi:MAG: fructose-bisphosphate aldolase [Chloroflexi bacterium]|nr:fructose-bisphosphate aldolase [Chloroflexota bacterium]